MRRPLISFFFVIFALTLITSCSKAEKPISIEELLDLGEKCLLEMEHEQALVQFLKVIEIDPMNPRGYTGAAEAYIGFDDREKAEAVLLDGLKLLPGDTDIQEMLEEIQSHDTDKMLEITDDVKPEEEPPSPLKIAENEPWKLFDNPVSANEIKFAGLPFWECTLDDIMNYYPDGVYHYKDSDGTIRDLEGQVYEGEMGWDTTYSSPDIQYSTVENRVYVGFSNVSEIRGISMEMSLDEALDLLGFSPDGISFVKEVEEVAFIMGEDGCSSAEISLYGSGYDDYSVRFVYSDVFEGGRMQFNVCFNDSGIRLIEILLSN